MTVLSPATQEIFWEFNRAASGKPEDWHYLPAIAAALRAAAAEMYFVADVEVLQAMADELDQFGSVTPD